MRRLFLITGITLAAAMVVLVIAFWLRFAAAWSAGQEPGSSGDDEPVERCVLSAQASEF